MSKHTYIVEEKRSNDWGAFVLFTVCLVYGKELLVIGLFVAAGWIALKIYDGHQHRKAMRMVAKAHEEVYLPYPYDDIYSGETMPLTYPIFNTFPYRDQELRDYK